MMSDIEAIAKALPGLDCGSCGAPNCTAFAEDVVKCESCADECTVILKRIMKERGVGSERQEILSHFDSIIQKNHQNEED
jgi:Na+-translocating ferredoxin:NAD+ oxidoreductase RNF subunit RnfB